MLLGIEGNGIKYSFKYGTSEGNMKYIAKDMDATICSTNIAKGFIGPYIGMYASSNGKISKNRAFFDWFEYKNL